MLLLEPSAWSASTPSSFTLKGTVLDAEDRPVPGARVELHPPPTGLPPLDIALTTHTEEPISSQLDGTFQIPLPPGAAVILIRKPGLAPSWKQFWNVQADVEERFVLSPPSTLGGIVVDAGDQPVAGAEVFASFAFLTADLGGGRRSYSIISGPPARQLFSTRTTADGRFQIENFPEQAVADLAIHAPGLALRSPASDRPIRPETMPGRAGRQDLRLVVESAGQIEGRVVTQGAGPVPTPITLWMQPQQPGVLARQDPLTAADDGTFRIPDLAAGTYRLHATFGTNAFPDLVAEPVPVSVEAGQTSDGVTILATPGGVLRVRTLSAPTQQTAAGANIHAHGQHYHTTAISDDHGSVAFRLPPGSYQVGASQANARSPEQHITIQTSQTQQIELILEPPPTITGVVLDPQRQPAAALEVMLFGGYFGPGAARTTTDDQGRYSITWDPRRFSGIDHTVCLIVRDPARNLAIARDIDDETRELDLHLEPGLTLAGRIETIDGTPLPDAVITLFLWSGNMGTTFGEPNPSDAAGRFEMSALPHDRRYSLSATAAGYGSANQQVDGETNESNRVELEPFILRVADLPLAGQLLDADDQPVVGAYVNIQGDGQPNASTQTDQDGRFAFDAVCEGLVRLFASAQNSYGSATAEAGDTNIVLRVGTSQHQPVAPQRPTLTGRPLPDLSAVGLDASHRPDDRPLVLCLFDAEQRPSRRAFHWLAEQQETLARKGVVVAAVQVVEMDNDTFQTWIAANPAPFPVGRIPAPSAETQWATGVAALPWLILADAHGRVVADGFGIEELDDKLQQLGE
jgi:hypothetical protein